MARWEPNARGRLEQAALELFEERGYSRTTVEEIAARAGLTERTFFRYYADKREVLFWGAPLLQQLLVDTIAAAPAGTAPLEAVARALAAAADLIPPDRARARSRQDLIAAHPELKEREQMKLTSLAAAAAEALRCRHVGEPAASLTAEAGIAVFKVAFESWIEDTRSRDLKQHIRLALAELRAVVADPGTSTSTSTKPGPPRPRPRPRKKRPLPRKPPGRRLSKRA